MKNPTKAGMLAVIATLLTVTTIRMAQADGLRATQFDRQAELAVMCSLGSDDWPVLIALDLIATRDRGTGQIPEDGSSREVPGGDAETYQVNLGIRKEWGKQSFHPFPGGGVAVA